MPKVDYPQGTDLADYLLEFGLTVTNTAALNTLAAAGVARFETEVGRTMLAPLPSSTRYYDPPPDGLLDLGADLAAAPTVTYTPLGGNPEAFTVATDYRLEPQNALARGKPIERILFGRRWWYPYSFGQIESVAVTGIWGYGATIPDDAWLAMLAAGAAPFWDKQTISAGGGTLTAWKEGNSSATYAAPTAADWVTVKQNFLIGYPAVVANYTKVVMG